VLALTMIPLVNLVIMPVAVIAGVLIWVEQLSGLPLKQQAVTAD
jgi:CysZ protein